MAECIICKAYTKYKEGHCLSCYNGLKENESFNNSDINKKNDVELNRSYNMIKGRIAETLIQELFLSLDYNVFRYGMENTVPGIMQLLKGVRDDVSLAIRRMPDFVVQNPRTKHLFFVEVKFRASGEFKLSNLDKDYPYDNAHIVLVSKRHIKCLSVAELKEGKEITATSTNYLGSRKEFDLDKEMIIKFCRFAVQFFQSV